MKRMTARSLAAYQHRTIALVSEFLRGIPYGLDLEEAGPWLHHAFWLSRLHDHLVRTLGEDGAFQYVSYLLKARRSMEIDEESYWTMVEAGHRPSFCRWWRKWTHDSYFHFQHHFIQFREYHKPGQSIDGPLLY
jgi:hypothetical protein